jgi:hypothetical protein
MRKAQHIIANFRLHEHVATLVHVALFAGLKCPCRLRVYGSSSKAAARKLNILKLNSSREW